MYIDPHDMAYNAPFEDVDNDDTFYTYFKYEVVHEDGSPNTYAGMNVTLDLIIG